MNQTATITHEQILETLSKVPWLAPLAPELQHELAESVRVYRLNDGETFVERGQPGPGLAIVHDGLLEMGSVGPSGRNLLLLVLQRGQTLLQIPTVQNTTASLTSRSRGPTTLLVVPRPQLLEIMAANSQLAISLLKDVGNRARLLIDLVETRATLPPLPRVASSLLLAMEAYAPEGLHSSSFEFNFSQSDIADMLGMSRQSLGVYLKQLEQDGAIEIGYRAIRIVNAARLQALL